MSPSPTGRGRRVLIAVVLAGLAPPGGHVFVGRPARGFALLAAAIGAGLLWVFAAPRSLGLAQAAALPGLLLLLALILDAGMLARRSAEVLPPRRLNRWWVYVALALFTQLAVPDALRRVLADRAGILLQPDAAMEPVVLQGERVVFERTARSSRLPEREELVVVRDESASLRVRRVAGLPGESVAVEQGRVLVDGRRSPTITTREMWRSDLALPPRRVDAGEVLVLGDRLRAEDPVQGPVALDSIAGRPTWVVLPPGFPLDPQLGARLGQQLR